MTTYHTFDEINSNTLLQLLRLAFLNLDPTDIDPETGCRLPKGISGLYSLLVKNEQIPQGEIPTP